MYLKNKEKKIIGYILEKIINNADEQTKGKDIITIREFNIGYDSHFNMTITIEDIINLFLKIEPNL